MTKRTHAEQRGADGHGVDTPASAAEDALAARLRQKPGRPRVQYEDEPGGWKISPEAAKLAAEYAVRLDFRDGRYFVGCEEFPGVEGWGESEEVATDLFRKLLGRTITVMLDAMVRVPSPGGGQMVTKCVKMGPALLARGETFAIEKGWSFSRVVREALEAYLTHAQAENRKESPL